MRQIAVDLGKAHLHFTGRGLNHRGTVHRLVAARETGRLNGRPGMRPASPGASRWIPLLLLPVLLAGGCSNENGSTPTVARSDSAGVEIISVLGDVPTLQREYREKMVLGGVLEGPGSFFQVNASLVDVDPEGRIHVLDPMNHRIVRFSPEGEVLGTVGREGGGPAEFGQPFALAVRDDGILVVADRARNGLTRLSPTGEALEPVEVEAPIYGAAELALVDTTPVFRWWQWTGRASGYHQLVWGAVDPRMVAQIEVRGEEGQRSFPSCPQGFPGAPYLDPGLVWATSRAGATVVPGHDYEIRFLSPEGDLRRIIRRGVGREPVEVEALLEHMDDPFMANTGRGPQALCPVPLEEAIRIKGHLDRIPAITALAISDQGEIWARRGAIPFTAGAIDIFDAGGKPLGTLPPGTPFPVAFTRDGYASVREDDLGVQRLVVWESGS